MGWVTPKTNWVSTDTFNILYYNRIKNNLVYLRQLFGELYEEYGFIEMGQDITSYNMYWDANQFNKIESNLILLNSASINENFGEAATFYENGPFIRWDELNRIEKAILELKGCYERQKECVPRLSFRLGGI